MLKLNSIPEGVFNSVSTRDVCIDINGKKLSRNDIVTTGRLLLCEHTGKNLNKRPDVNGSFVSRLDAEHVDYATAEKKHREAKFLFCAALASKAAGRPAPETFEEAIKRNFFGNKAFMEAFNAIDVDVIDPVLPAMFEDIGAGGLMDIYTPALGETMALNVKSNEVFRFQDSAWGSSRSTEKNYLYGKTVTLNPHPYSCNATIKWYQDVVQGDAGRYYAAIFAGMWNKVYALFVETLLAGAADTKYVPSGLVAQSYTTGNMVNISTLVAAANNVNRSDLVIFGTPQVLNAVLPVDTNGAILGLQYGLGEQWFTQGFIPRVNQMQVLEVNPVIVPGTQNSTLDTISLGDDLYIAAKGGYGYAPIALAIADGSPITLEASPSETADFTIDINVTAIMDVKPVFASKIGVIKNVI